MSDIKVALRADSGKYLARCNNCIPGAAYPDNAFVHVTEAQLMGAPWAQFWLEHLSNGKYALKADTGNYVTRCNNCVPKEAYPDSVTMHISEPQSYAQFSLKRLSNGKYALQADTGNYVARCNNCIPGAAYPDSAFIHVKEAELMSAPWAQWDLIVIP